MGCDIHLYIEHKKFSYDDKERKNGFWIMKNNLEVNSGYYLYPEDKENKFRIIDCDVGRDYNLFSILAGVRISGIFDIMAGNKEKKTHFEPKGFPKDACDIIKEEYERWGSDGHTPSFLTLKELKTYFDNKNNKVIFSGMIDEKQYKSFLKTKEKNKPEYDLLYPYCAHTTMKNHINFSEEVPISYNFKYFNKILNKMKKIKYSNDTDEDIRIIFWFDN